MKTCLLYCTLLCFIEPGHFTVQNLAPSLSLDISGFHVLSLNFHVFIVVFYRKVNC